MCVILIIRSKTNCSFCLSVISATVSPDSKARNGGEGASKASEGGHAIQEMLSSHILTVVFACLFIVAVVLLALTCRYFARKAKADDVTALLD